VPFVERDFASFMFRGVELTKTSPPLIVNTPAHTPRTLSRVGWSPDPKVVHIPMDVVDDDEIGIELAGEVFMEKFERKI
jgi:hypothetical protein